VQEIEHGSLDPNEVNMEKINQICKTYDINAETFVSNRRLFHWPLINNDNFPDDLLSATEVAESIFADVTRGLVGNVICDGFHANRLFQSCHQTFRYLYREANETTQVQTL